MRTPSVNPARSIETTRRKRVAGSDGGGFFQHLGSEPVAAAEELSPLSPASALAALLDVQEVDADAQGRNRQAAGRYAAAVLDRLDALRDDVINGQVSPARLLDLAQALRADRPASQDPRLDELVDEIALRAEVEIAKFGLSS